MRTARAWLTAAAFRLSIQRHPSFRTIGKEHCERTTASCSRAPLWSGAPWPTFLAGSSICQLRKNNHAFNIRPADALFRQDRLNDLVADVEERRYLKLRSLNRTEYLERLFQTAGIPRPDVGARQLFDAAFNAGINTAMIEACARDIYREERDLRRARETELVNQLYRVQEFNWGGLHHNSLEKTTVD